MKGYDTRARILQEALALFARHGYEGAKVEKIAAGVGINKASLYFHFKGKEEIFRELFQDIVKEYSAKIKSLFLDASEKPTRQRLIAIYRGYLEYNLNNSEMDFWNRIYYLPPELMREEITGKTKEAEAVFQQELAVVFSTGIKRGEVKPLDPLHLAKTFYYLLTCIGMSTEIMDDEYGLREMDICFNIFWQGVRQ